MGIQYGQEERCMAGHTGFDGAEDLGVDGAAAWVRHSAADRADQRRSPAPQLRHPIPGAAQTGAGGLHRVRMGRLGQQSQGQVLQADAGGSRAAETGSKGVERDGRHHRSIFDPGEGGVMRKLGAGWVRLGGWWGREGRERELREELEAHFQMHVEDNLRAGMSAAEARREAALRFGSVEAAKESVRGGWTVGFLETTRQDLVYAVRGLRRNPAFALTAALSLALGIASGVSIFTVADNLVIRPLPYHDPGRLVMVWETNHTRARNEYNVVSPGNYRDWKVQNNAFESMGAFGDGRGVLDDGHRVEEVGVQYMTADLLPMLGVPPYRGPFLSAAANLPNVSELGPAR